MQDRVSVQHEGSRLLLVRFRSSKMMSWFPALLLLWWLPGAVESSAAAPRIQKARYNNSFRLTRSTRSSVQQLLRIYKAQQLGDEGFQYKAGRLSDLPSLSTDFYTWLRLQDGSRLRAALTDMQAYRKRLEQLESAELRDADGAVPWAVENILLDLRDLMDQVANQMKHLKMPEATQTVTQNATPTKMSTSKTLWERRVEGYITLRDLDLYLTKLARDFLLLASGRN